jgi:hypothetical protein
MRTTATERWECVEAFHTSGLIDFCEERGLNPKTFYAGWKRYVSDDEVVMNYTENSFEKMYFLYTFKLRIAP